MGGKRRPAPSYVIIGAAVLSLPPFVDCHHHLWDLDANYYPWLSDLPVTPTWGDHTNLKRNYRLADFMADATGLPLVKSVHVQAEHDPRDPVRETRWLQEVADGAGSAGFPHGIVAFADLGSPELEAVLESHARYPNLRGIRQILNQRKDPWRPIANDPLDDPAWCRNIAVLRRFGLSFDLQIYYQQMGKAAALARRHPEVTIILNHAGMPARRDTAGLEGWRSGIRTLAACPNVMAKLSGFGMVEPDWTAQSIRPFVLHVIDAFGIDRCMVASNFPVDRLWRGYRPLWQAYDEATADLGADDRRQLFHDNAIRIYRL